MQIQLEEPFIKDYQKGYIIINNENRKKVNLLHVLKNVYILF